MKIFPQKRSDSEQSVHTIDLAKKTPMFSLHAEGACTKQGVEHTRSAGVCSPHMYGGFTDPTQPSKEIPASLHAWQAKLVCKRASCSLSAHLLSAMARPATTACVTN